MSLTRKIILNTAVNIAGQGLSYLLGAVSMMLTMRYLGPESFGTYSLVLVYVGIVGGVAELGGQIILIRELNQRPAESSRIIGNFILLKAALYLLAFALGMGATWLMGYKGDMRFLLVLGLLSMLFSFPVSLGAVFQARMKIWYSVAINLGGKIIVISVVLAMIWLHKGLELLLWGNIVIATLSALVYWILVGRQETPDYRPDRKLLADLLRQSAPMGLLVVVGGLVFRSDVLLLSKLSDPHSLGLYSAAYKYVEWGLLVTFGALVSHLPVFSQYLKTEPEKVKRLFRISFDILGLFLIPVSVFTAFNAREMINLISGPAYVNGSEALSLLIWVVLLNSWNSMPVHLLVAGRKIGALIAIYFPVMAVNIAVNYFGIPKYGFMVCAFSSVLSEILAMAPLLILLSRWYGLKPDWASSAKHIFICILAASPLLIIPQSQLFIRGLAYVAGWLGLGIITKSIDIASVKEIYLKMRTK